MDTNHTPGPWAIQSEESALDFAMEYWIQDANGEDICSCSDEGTAHLIAAAPDLLEALKEVLDCDKTRTSFGAVMRARAAITKATGAA